MTVASIPVDLFNPGQILACLGLMEIAQVLFGEAEGRFDWDIQEDTRFELRAPGRDAPIGDVLAWLAKAELTVLVPEDGQYDVAKWLLSLEFVSRSTAYPVPAPNKAATLPVVLRVDRTGITVSSWADTSRTGRGTYKLWAGQTYGAGLLARALERVRDRLTAGASDPFSIRTAGSSSLRLDYRGEYVPLHSGFSPNSHGSRIGTWSYSAVDTLGAIGLAHARPLCPDARDKLLYRYAVLGGAFFDVSLHRAALGCAALPYPTRFFRIQLDRPSKGDRSITAVTESSRP